MSTEHIRRRRPGALLAGGVALVAGSLAIATAGLAPGPAHASSHREAPLISGQPQYDNTDVYAFTSPDRPDTTTFVLNWLPFEDPSGGPNFYRFAKDAHYDLHIDSDGDGQGELLYRWSFQDHYRNGNTFLYNTGPVTSLDDPDLNFYQTYDIDLIKLDHQQIVSDTKVAKGLPVAPSNVGKASIPNYGTLRDQAVKQLPDGSTSYAGQADDPFALDLRVFDLLYGGNLSEVGNDTLKGYNVQTIALQVPTAKIRQSAAQPIIGLWSTTERQNAAGDWIQVSRLGSPLVNEVVIPTKDKDKFNASAPWNDAQFAKYVTDPELPKLIQKVYGIKAPATPRNDLVSAFLTGIKGLNQPPDVRPEEELRLNTSIKPADKPNRLGALAGDNAGFPNGRRLTDDVVDIELQVAEGALVGQKTGLGDGVNANDKAFGKSFPYVALPHSGSRGPLAKAAGNTAGKSSATKSPGAALGTTNQLGSDTVANASSTTPWVLVGSGSGIGVLVLAVLGLWWFRRPGRNAADAPTRRTGG